MLIMTTKRRPRNPECASASPRWQKQWRIDRARGIKRTLPAEACQQHVQALVAQHGVSIRSIADAAGVTPQAVSLLNRGIKKTVAAETQRRILELTAQKIFDRSNKLGFVPNIGARRRVQALLAIGWRHQDLRQRLGFNSGTMLHQVGDWISRGKHDAVKKVYDELWNVPGPAPATSRARIAKAGYAPPLAWDDDTIDDPSAEPDLGAQVTVRGRPPADVETVRAIDALVEDVEFLVRTGSTLDEALERLRTNAKALERQLHRAGRGDLMTALRNPVRESGRHSHRASNAA